jgi:flagellar motor switch/type III secretory pathway protein FliN
MAEKAPLERMADVPLELRAELDRRLMKVREILAWRTGTVLPTTKPATGTIDIWVDRVRLGSGEVVDTETRLQVRMTAFERPKIRRS